MFSELKNFIAKTSGAPTFIRGALQGLEDKIDIALIFGSVAKGTCTGAGLPEPELAEVGLRFRVTMGTAPIAPQRSTP